MVTETSTTITSRISQAAIETLTAVLEGELIQPGDAGYDDARQVWNGMIDRFPAAIVRCRTVEDVVSSLRFAREHELPLAVRGGGHNAAGLAVLDNGLVIDLSEMNAVVVDPERRIARAGGGATWADFDAATQAHGLAATGGAVSMTGVGGLTLGGGLGWLMRLYGLAATTSSVPRLSWPTGRWSKPARQNDQSCCGGCAAGVATSASSPSFCFVSIRLTASMPG